jgi:signal transduction histidine kinase
MSNTPPSPERPRREALWLAVAIWGLTYPLFLVPSLAIDHPGKDSLPLAFGLDVLVGLALTAPLYLAIRRSFHLPPRSGLALAVAAVLAITALESVADAMIHEWLIRRHPIGFGWNLWGRAQLNAIVYLPLYGLYAVGLALLRSHRTMRIRERQLADATAAAHQAQLAALRYQLNPHFLFNTLNAISTLIVIRRNDEAEAMMSKLADFLRASLGADPQTFILLEDELATVQAYLDIEGVRFGERLAVEVACPAETADALVPSFLLQPLVENAIKYAVAPARRTVTIRIEAAVSGEDLVLIVEDDGEPADEMSPRGGTGVGLRNVRERLRALYGERGVLAAAPRQRGFSAMVHLPLRRRAGVAEAA